MIKAQQTQVFSRMEAERQVLPWLVAFTQQQRSTGAGIRSKGEQARMIQGGRGGLLGSLKSLLSPLVNANSVSIGPDAMADLELLPPQESCMAAT